MRWETRPLTVLALGLVLAFSLAIPGQVKPANAQEFSPHDPIRITSDSDFTNANSGVVGGTGTSQDPFIIEGWEITATTGPGRGSIDILNTRSYFIIRNVYIHPTSLVQEASGIRINNIENGVVENSRITNNTYGIWLGSSQHNSVQSNTAWNNTNGIYIIGGQNNTISSNQVLNNKQYGIWLSNAAFMTFRGNKVTGSAAGFILGGSHDNLLEDNLSYNNIDNATIPTGYGFRITASANNRLRNNTVLQNPFGMIFEVSTGNLATSNNVTLNQYGMGLEGRNKNNTFTSNRVINNQYGIYVFNSSQNIVYNNYLQNTGNAYDNTVLNYWNKTKSPGTNILGGAFLGGNFYSDYTGLDQNGDGIGDTPYSITGVYPTPNQDYLPLVVHDIAAALTAQPSSVRPGRTISITATFENRGAYSESFTGSVLVDGTQLSTRDITNLPPTSQTTIEVQWDTGGQALGPHNVTATATVVLGENNTDNNKATTTVTIAQNIPPDAMFTVTPSNPLVEQEVSFDATASSDPDGTISIYEWNFGDGTSGTGVAVTHTYLTGGTFQVRLTVTDNEGATGCKDQLVLASPVVVDVKVAALSAAPLVVGPHGIVTISIMVSNVGNVPADFSVTSFANMIPVDTSEVVSLGPGQNSDLTLSWTLDDQPPGLYSLSARIPQLQGEVNTADNTLVGNTVRVNSPPSADFAFTITVNGQIRFNASASTDQDGTVIQYYWDFGDGQNATVIGPATSHVYFSSGNFTVTLTVYDNDGAFGSAMKRVSSRPTPTGGLGTQNRPDDYTSLIYATAVALLASAGLFMVFRRWGRNGRSVER